MFYLSVATTDCGLPESHNKYSYRFIITEKAFEISGSVLCKPIRDLNEVTRP